MMLVEEIVSKSVAVFRLKTTIPINRMVFSSIPSMGKIYSLQANMILLTVGVGIKLI